MEKLKHIVAGRGSPHFFLAALCLVAFVFYPAVLKASESTQFKSKIEVIKYLQKNTAAKEFKELKLDINLDQNKELLVGTDCSREGPCLYHIFEMLKSGGFQFKGTVLLHSFFEVLAQKSNGYCDILQAQMDSNNHFQLVRYEFNGKDYKPGPSIRTNSKVSTILKSSLK